MLEPPITLSEATLRTGLTAHYGLTVRSLTFLPLGHDALAAVYRVESDEPATYFLKVRTRPPGAAGLLVPRFLHDQGLHAVIAPLPTISGELWAAVGDFALILYPFVVGTPGMAKGLTDRQWIAYGALLRQVHEATPTTRLATVLPRESFMPPGVDLIGRLDEHLGQRHGAESAEQALADFWRAQRATISHLLAQATTLGQRLAATAPPLRLCHADIHTNNLLLEATGRVWIVDWDETMLAARERDLMFVVGGIDRRLVTPHQEALFFQGYGPMPIDPVALAYYRYAWAISDISAYGEQVCFRPDLSPTVRRRSVADFQSLFAPGRIVAIAMDQP